MNICLASSEVAPFAKTGGLADVSAALSRYLAAAGHDVRLIMPLYPRVRTAGGKDREFRALPELEGISFQMGSEEITYSVLASRLPDSELDVYFVDCPRFFAREDVYSNDADEPLRFAMLSRAALECCQRWQWAPDIVHCNDWHTAIMPLLLHSQFAWDKLFENTKSVLTIHNIGYQGVFGTDLLAQLGWEDSSDLLYQEDLAAGHVNFLKTGLLYADALTTVSETYAQEIQTAEFGMGLEELLRARSDRLYGIVNGVDYGEWSPENDEHLPHAYSAKDLEGKRRNKLALLEEAGLPPDEETPLLGVVSRLTAQKGFELFPDSLPVLLQRENVRFVLLGSGEERYEQYFDWLQRTFPDKVSFRAGYDNALAHRIEAGADMFLMPSRYEPCGLNQMYSLRYGTVPIVRKTGGLADTVKPFDPVTGEGTGFVFDEFKSSALLTEMAHALAVFRDKGAWRRLMIAGMTEDWSWNQQGDKYVQLYEMLTRR